MRALLLRFSSFHPSRLFSIPIPRQTRSPRLDLKPAATPFSALKFVRDFSWKLPNVGFVASMAFSAGNGGSGNPDDGSGKGDDDGEDEDGNDSNLVGSWSSPKDKEEEAATLFGLWKLVKLLRSLYCVWYHDDSTLLTKDLSDQFLQILAWPLVLFLTAFLDQLFCLVGIVLLCYYLTMGILAAALCVSVYLHCSRQLTPDSEETASNPPAGMECCICLSTREDGAVWRSLPCNHWFHSPCINSWIQINPTCPICIQDALRRT